MAKLVVEIDGRRVELVPGQQITFGRDRSCDLCLDPGDVGISRVAGRIAHDGGVWAVSNLSRKRALHIADAAGFAVPLPVSAPGNGASQRVIDQHTLTVLVAGERWTHAIVLRLDHPVATVAAPLPSDPVSTRTQVPRLTDERREVLVAMARGYLRAYPHYDPRPRTYQEVADLLTLTKSQVTRRVEKVREDLVQAGVHGLEQETDARRPLCEWLLAMRVIAPADLDWLQRRIDERGSEPGTPSQNEKEHNDAGKSLFPTTTHPAHDDISRIAERAARQIAPALLAQLNKHYGDSWLAAVNAGRRKAKRPRGRNLRDYRFCLSVLADDPATSGWLDERAREAARTLNRLANLAAHRATLTLADVGNARQLADRVTRSVPSDP
ncbi:MAG: hypothetical protein ACRDTE_10430 [Pseudonocardiaceae bacterium]